MAEAERDAPTGGAIEQQYYDGIVAALLWAAGDSPASPLTGKRLTHPDPGVMCDEMEVALDMLHRREALPAGRTIEYASGVESTLSWAIEGTDEAPVNLDLLDD